LGWNLHRISVETKVALERPIWSSAEEELYDIVNYQKCLKRA